MSTTYDLLIIGGGHNGLVTAAYAARAGLKVLVLERREVLGGACVTEEVWAGYKVSTAAYVNSLLRPEIIRELELKRHGFEMLPRNPSSFTPFPDGRSLMLGPNKAMTHREIAKYVTEKYQIPGWWAQTVTVGYERIKGLRAVGQRRDGSFEANKSKTFAVPLAQLYGAFSNARTRSRWLSGVNLTVRTATREKSMRITWPDRTSVEVGFTSKGAAKSQVALAHTKLQDQDSSARLKQYWSERLSALEDVLQLS